MNPTDYPIVSLDRSVTVAVAAHGNAQATQTCLQAILGSAEGDYELLLVDDCSHDENATLNVYREAKSIHPNTTIFQTNELNLEYSGSVNAILSHAAGSRIFFVSNDILVNPYYFSALLEVAESEPMVGVARGSSNFVDNGLESHNLKLINEIQDLQDVFKEGRDVYSLFGSLRVPEQYLTGDAFMVTRSLVEKIGTFDPFFYGYFADHDYGLRAQLAGYSTLLVPGAYAYHMAQANFTYLDPQKREEKLRRRWFRIMENWARFKVKYSLPVELEYTSLNDLSWEKLREESFSPERHYSPPGDYASYVL